MKTESQTRKERAIQQIPVQDKAHTQFNISTNIKHIVSKCHPHAMQMEENSILIPKTCERVIIKTVKENITVKKIKQ